MVWQEYEFIVLSMYGLYWYAHTLADWKGVYEKISNCLAKSTPPENHLKSEHLFTSLHLAFTGATNTTVNLFMVELQGLGVEFLHQEMLFF